jgi:Family of unknown function (DUF6178)
MPKRLRDARRRVGAARRTPHRIQKSDRRIARVPRDERGLLERILDTPDAAHVVARLPPAILHRVIETCGLESCTELVALATPAQLMRVLDLDLWLGARAGLDEQLDAQRFGLWLGVLMDCGVEVAAAKLAGLDLDLIVAGLAQHVLVFDRAAVAPHETTDGDEVAPSRRLSDGGGCEIGGYLVEPQRVDSWDAITGLLQFLATDRPDYFARVMRGCRALSNSGFEIDGLHDLLAGRDQDMFDLAFDREERRERQGFVTPAQARAFLQMARQLPLAQEEIPPPNSVAAAYFRAIDWTAPVDADASEASSRMPPASASARDAAGGADAVAAVVDMLLDAGLLEQPPRALLQAPHDDAPRLESIQAQMQFACDRDQVAYAARNGELVYLANALAAGCSVQARPFTLREASDAAAATCNLGLENWPRQWRSATGRDNSDALDAGALPEDFLVHHDLLSVFQVGWTVLHERVGMYAAGRLVGILAGFQCADREIQRGLDELRIALTRHWRDRAPWRAREALDAIMILDTPAWAALVGLIDECPVLHAGIGAARGSGMRAIGASAFEFISENRQIRTTHDFMESLPALLRT